MVINLMYYKAAISNVSSFKFVCFVGLPGYAHLLETFAKCLFEKLRATHSIWVLSYCRFCEENCDNGKTRCFDHLSILLQSI